MHVQALVRPMQRGSSQPWLVTASDGGEYVVTLSNNCDGVNVVSALVGAAVATGWALAFLP